MTIREATAHLPSGLHDAHIECFVHDVINARVTVQLRIPMEPSYRVERRGTLVLEGVQFWYVDPPSGDWLPIERSHVGLMMDDCGGRPATCKHEWPDVPMDCFEDAFYSQCPIGAQPPSHNAEKDRIGQDSLGTGPRA